MGILFGMMSLQGVIFIVVLLITLLIFGGTIAMMVSPKLRGKFMSRQVRSLKHMAQYSKDDITDMMTDLGNASIKAQSNIINENKDSLKDMATSKADINKEAIKTVVHSIKDGLSDDLYCKHCGKLIANDSTFCKYCGKKQ